jgi:hypothetical protein
MRVSFVDTGVWYALADDRVSNHAGAIALLADPRRPVASTNWVLAETVTLARRRLGHRPAVEIRSRLVGRPGLRLVRIQPRDEQAAWQIFQRYADKDFSFTDCTSFAVMRRLRLAHALAFDRHFQQMGFRVN